MPEKFLRGAHAHPRGCTPRLKRLPHRVEMDDMAGGVLSLDACFLQVTEQRIV